MEHTLYICFGHCGKEYIWKSKCCTVVQTSKVNLGGHYRCDFCTNSCIIENLSFWTVLQTRTKPIGRCGIIPECVTACILLEMISPVLCLLNVLHLFPSLSDGNPFEEWLHSEISLIAGVYSEMPLSSSSGLQWKIIDLANVTMWGQLIMWGLGRGEDPYLLSVQNANIAEGSLR